MAQITNYTTLSAAIEDWDERSHDVDELIGLAEAEFRLYLGPNYSKETTATLTFTSGVASVPTGYLRAISMTHATGGPMSQVSLDALNTYNPFGVSGIPALYAISGASIKTAPVFDGTASFTYEGTLTGLSGSNATNWLMDKAPQAYLSMCMYFAKAKYLDPAAGAYRDAALTALGSVNFQDTVARYGHASMAIRGATP